jgi:hypothetical protein
MTSKIEHNEQLEWPNGQGYTPCSTEYATTYDARNAIYNPNEEGRTLNSLSAADYQEWCSLDHKLGTLQLQGHTGKGVRY